MTKRMIVDATHPEETRVAIVDGNWLEDFDFERANKKQLKGNIYLAKVIRIEPSLQAAFVEYGGNRHGFLPFTEIHPDYFRIPMADRPHDAPPEEELDPADAAENANYTAEQPVEGEAGEHHHDDHGDHADHGHDEHHDHDHAHDHDHDHDNAHYHAESAEPSSITVDLPPEGQVQSISAEAPTQFGEAPAITNEFASQSPDLGLITDFGNAALDPSAAPAPILPPETVGGEPAVEEARFRRPPRPRYKIQEVVKRRQVMLIQVVKEERGNKGAALTSFLSLAGRYCVLMPNTDHGGGVSRKITSHQDRRRMKEILDQLEIPEGMAVILRTAGMEQEIGEIKRDLEYLLRLWNNIREETLQSTAPALIYEEANLIKRSMRDMYAPDIEEILVAGPRGHQLATDFMRTIMPDQLSKVKLYEETVPLFFRYNVEKQIDQLYNPTVQLRSGGYIVINPTEALVSIDVNSGRATRERHIEGTALKTNLEAAEEIARQLRLRDLAGLVVIDFIDMEDGRNNAAVERRMREAMSSDRARLQIGRISPFGLLELSRQRLHPSLMEINFEKCPHCAGTGLIRSVDSAAISILRVVEEEGIRNGACELVLHVPTTVALYILNQKRSALSEIEARYSLQVLLHSDETLTPPDYKLERVRANGEHVAVPAVNSDQVLSDVVRPPSHYSQGGDRNEGGERNDRGGEGRNDRGDRGEGRGDRGGRGGRNRNRNRNNGGRDGQPRDNNQQRDHQPQQHQQAQGEQGMPAPEVLDANGNRIENAAMPADNIGNVEGGAPAQQTPGGPDQQRRGRRRGRRGGRGRRNGQGGNPNGGQGGQNGGYQGQRDGQPRDNNGQQRDGQQRDHQPRNDQNRGNWNQNRPQGDQQPMAAPVIPASIHDIDTTPRANYTPSSQQRNPSSPPPYEVVNDGDDKPKGGWWRKLTGQ